MISSIRNYYRVGNIKIIFPKPLKINVVLIIITFFRYINSGGGNGKHLYTFGFSAYM